VQKVMIAEALDIKKEYYFAVNIDFEKSFVACVLQNVDSLIVGWRRF
jgi:succinyl-CoA synthetase beta subunit